MSLINLYQIWRLAKKDGRADNYQAENRIKAEIGEEEPFDVEAFEDQGFVADDLQAESILSEYEQLTPEEEARTQIAVPAPVLGVLAALFGTIGTLASIQLAGLMGWIGAHRLLLGIGVESLVIALTGAVHSVFRGQIKNVGAQVTMIALYAAVLIATGTVRLNEVASGEGFLFMDLSAGFLMVCAIAGPGWLLEICLRLLIQQAAHRRVQRLNARHLKEDRRKVRNARLQLEEDSRKRRQHQQDYARLKAIYKSRYTQFHKGNGSTP